MLNYDVSNGTAVQVVRIRYAHHEFNGQVEIEVRGSDRGLETMEWALELHWEQLARAAAGDAPPVLRLHNVEGDELEIEDDALLQVEWLKEYCVGLEILSIEPEAVAQDLAVRADANAAAQIAALGQGRAL